MRNIQPALYLDWHHLGLEAPTHGLTLYSATFGQPFSPVPTRLDWRRILIRSANGMIGCFPIPD